MDDSIYFCYAREDMERIHEIFIAFKQAGLRPWMDKPPKEYQTEGLRPGDDWDIEFRKKISAARIFMPFLSKISIEKHGYVQKEYKMALAAQMERPPGKSPSFIPVLLEKLEVPDIRVDAISLKQYQWYELYVDGIEGLIDALRGKWGVPTQIGEDKRRLYFDYIFKIDKLRELGIQRKTLQESPHRHIRLLGLRVGQEITKELSELRQLNHMIQMTSPDEIQKVAKKMEGVALLYSLPGKVISEEKFSKTLQLYESEYKPEFIKIARKDCGIDL